MILNVAEATYYNTIAAVASAAAELTPRRATQGVGGSDFKGGGSITHQISKVWTHNRKKGAGFSKKRTRNPELGKSTAEARGEPTKQIYKHGPERADIASYLRHAVKVTYQARRWPMPGEGARERT